MRVTLWNVAVVLAVVLRLTMWLKKNECGLMFVCYLYKQLHEVGEWFFESFSTFGRDYRLFFYAFLFFCGGLTYLVRAIKIAHGS